MLFSPLLTFELEPLRLQGIALAATSSVLMNHQPHPVVEESTTVTLGLMTPFYGADTGKAQQSDGNVRRSTTASAAIRTVRHHRWRSGNFDLRSSVNG